MAKIPFDIDAVITSIETSLKPYPKAALFELFEDGYQSLFEQLVACIISIRTLDEVTLVVTRRLFEHASTAPDIASLNVEEIDRLIHPSNFHERKAAQIKEIARRAAQDFGGDLPCDFDLMVSFSGVGLKCANLALGIACGQARVSADVHVHRVTNRWGYVQTTTPERTSQALEEKLPEKYFLTINRLLVPFGKHICTGRLPRCSTCPVLKYCRQVGVEKHR